MNEHPEYSRQVALYWIIAILLVLVAAIYFAKKGKRGIAIALLIPGGFGIWRMFNEMPSMGGKKPPLIDAAFG